MDKNLQLCQVAQDLINQLVGFIQSPVRPDHAIVQAALDAAGQRAAVIRAAGDAQPPLTVPQIAPTP